MGFVLGAALLISPVFSAPVSAEEAATEDPNFSYKTITTREGLTFRVPEDMPIENRNGIQTPIPFDQYMYGKFKQIENKLKEVDAKLDRIEKMLISMQEDKPKVLSSR